MEILNTALLLCGPRQERDANLLKVHGETLLEQSFYKLKDVFQKIFIIAPSYEQQNAYLKLLPEDILVDLTKDSSYFTQFFTGLKSCHAERVFVAASNMPFLNKKVIQVLLAQDTFPAVVPRYVNGNVEPLHSFYDVLPALEAVKDSINDEQFSFESALEKISNVNYFPVGELMKVNPKLDSFFKVESQIDFESTRAKLEQTSFKKRLTKASTLIEGITKDSESANAIYYIVPGTKEEHEIRYDKRKKSWTCDCHHFTMKGTYCSHIFGAQELLSSTPKELK